MLDPTSGQCLCGTWPNVTVPACRLHEKEKVQEMEAEKATAVQPTDELTFQGILFLLLSEFGGIVLFVIVIVLACMACDSCCDSAAERFAQKGSAVLQARLGGGAVKAHLMGRRAASNVPLLK